MKNKEKETIFRDRRCYSRIPDEEKRKVVQEITSGVIGLRGAGRKYGIHRNTIAGWMVKFSLLNFKPLEIANCAIHDMDEKAKIRELSRQIRYLSKELDNSRLRVRSLETLISVSEEELKIKIRKKSGAKQSKK